MRRSRITLFVALISASAIAEQAVVPVDLPPLPDFNIIEYVKKIVGPKRTYCKVSQSSRELCLTPDAVKIVGAISDSDATTIIEIVHKQVGVLIIDQITGDSQAAKVTASRKNFAVKEYTCYQVATKWTCFESAFLVN